MQTVGLNVGNDVVKRRRVVPKLGTTKQVKLSNPQTPLPLEIRPA